MAASDNDLVDVTVTGPNIDMMADLLRSLVEAKLIGCGNIIPAVRSIYTWQGQVEDDTEVLAILHTRAGVVDQVMAHIVDKHPDDAPQIIVLPVVEALPAYRDWLIDATSG